MHVLNTSILGSAKPLVPYKANHLSRYPKMMVEKYVDLSIYLHLNHSISLSGIRSKDLSSFED